MFRKNKTAEEAAKSSPSNVAEYSKRTRTFIMVGLILGTLMAAMNQTIVGTSIPKIVGEFGGMSIYSWLFTAYILAEIVIIPIAGKLSDRYGRRPIFMIGMLLFLAGTILASTAGSMEMLIAYMFVQGLGAGVLIPVSAAAVADMYPPSELGKMQGLMGAVFAVGTVIAPFLGGYFVDNVGWRWVFWINVPIGILAIVVTALKFPKVQKREAPKHIDFLGMASLTASLTAFLLVLTWGGGTYSWDSAEILGLSILSIMALVAFVVVEQRAEDPILPLRLFRGSIFTLSSVGLLVVGLGLFGVISFLPMFQQAVIGMTASSSGETLIPLMVGLMLTTMISGLMIKHTRYKIWLLFGPSVAALGLYFLSTLGVGSSQTDAIVYTFIVGLGLGMLISTYLVAAQNVTRKKDIGVVTASLTLFRSLGSAIGLALLGSIVNRQMVVELSKNLPAGAAAALPATDVNILGGLLLNPQAAAQIPTAIIDAIRLSLSNSMTYMFWIAAVLVLCVTVVNVFMKRVPRRSEYDDDEKKPEEMVSMNLYKRILIPTDGSKYSRSAIEHALEIAKLSGAEVTALTVIDPTKATTTIQDLSPSPRASSMTEWAEAASEEATLMAKEKGVNVKTEIRMGDPANIINEMSDNYDLIVMGTRGLHGLPHLVLGSVAEKVIRGSKCPVTVVKNDQVLVERTPSDVSESPDAT